MKSVVRLLLIAAAAALPLAAHHNQAVDFNINQPMTLKRQCVTKDSFMPGETIVDVIAAKDGSHIADGKWGGTLILPNGVRAVLPSWTALGAQALVRDQKK